MGSSGLIPRLILSAVEKKKTRDLRENERRVSPSTIMRARMAID